MKFTRRIYMPRRYAGLGPSRVRTRIHSFDSSARSKGIASEFFTLPFAITTFPVSLPPSSPGDIQSRLPLFVSGARASDHTLTLLF